MMTLDDYDRHIDENRDHNPAPVEAIALIFKNGRACVYVRDHRGWCEMLSAPCASEEGLACAIDMRVHASFATASHSRAGGSAE